MPILQILSPDPPPSGLLDRLCHEVAVQLSIPEDLVWAFWNTLPAGRFRQPQWQKDTAPGPIVFLHCRTLYSQFNVEKTMDLVCQCLAQEVGCETKNVFIAVQRVHPYELRTQDKVWKGEDRAADAEKVVVSVPIGFVRASRTEAIDDHWGEEISVIELDPNQFTAESVSGLRTFSHLEVIFFMHRVPEDEIQRGARHPRGRTDWPQVGIFAQRAKGRPNRLGVSRCNLLNVEGLSLSVQGLDAIDSTPVLDIKPYFREFGPRGEIMQPDWVTEIMSHYYY